MFSLFNWHNFQTLAVAEDDRDQRDESRNVDILFILMKLTVSHWHAHRHGQPLALWRSKREPFSLFPSWDQPKRIQAHICCAHFTKSHAPSRRRVSFSPLNVFFSPVHSLLPGMDQRITCFFCCCYCGRKIAMRINDRQYAKWERVRELSYRDGCQWCECVSNKCERYTILDGGGWGSTLTSNGVMESHIMKTLLGDMCALPLNKM